MERHELIAWIREEITSTTVRLCEEVVGYEEEIQPNPEMNCSEFTDWPTTGDRHQYIIVTKSILGPVPRTVLDERRASGAAEALVALILADERYISLAEELMKDRDIFAKYWEQLCQCGKDAKTKRIALRHVGRAPSQLFLKKLGKILSAVKEPLGFVCKFLAAVCVYATMIYAFWPDSRAGLWIGRTVKYFLLEAKRIVSG